MFLSKRKSGTWHVYYTGTNSKLTSISTHTKLKSEALQFLKGFDQKIKAKEIPIPVTLFEFTDIFLKAHSAVHTEKTQAAFQNTFNFFKKNFGNIFISGLDKRKLNEYLEGRAANSSIYQARKDLINLSSAFNYAVFNNYLSENPCKRIKPYKLPEKQPLFFTEAEFDKLLSVIDDRDIKDLVRFALAVGCRQQELLWLKWRQVDFQREQLTLDNRGGFLCKSKKVHTVPLNADAMEILKCRQQNSVIDFVFTYHNVPIKQNLISKKFKTYVRKSGVREEMHFHTIRHSTASFLVQKGVNIYEVSKLLGHSSVNTTSIYSHVTIEDLKPVVRILERHEESVMDSPEYSI